MKIDLRKFLSFLNVTIADPKIFDNIEIGKSVFSFSCPLHNDFGSSMVCSFDAASEKCIFSCRDKMCHFKGNPFDLYAQIKNIRLPEACRDFMPGGPMESYLLSPLSEAEITTYVSYKNTQAEIHRFLNDCVQNLRKNPDKSRLRPGMSSTTLRMVPPDVGMFSNDMPLPECFSSFSSKKYDGDHFLLFPYKNNDEICHFDVYNTKDLSVKIPVSVTNGNKGVLPEFYTEGTVFITDDPLTYSTIYGNYSTCSSIHPPLYLFSGLPFSSEFGTHRRISLLSTVDRPLSLRTALLFMTNTDHFEGSHMRAAIFVWSSNMLASSIGYQEISNHLGYEARHDVPVTEWVVRKMSEMIRAGKTNDLVDILTELNLSQAAVSELLKASKANGNDSSVSDLLIQSGKSSSCTFLLGNGKLIKCMPTEISLLGANGGVVTLCNVGITVLNKIRAYNNSIFLSCKITSKNPSVPQIHVDFPENSWNKPVSIKRCIDMAYAKDGYSPYVAVYGAKGCAWSDVFAKLSENCSFLNEIQTLGPDENGDIHFPKTVLRGQNNQFDVQKQIFSIPDRVLSLYKTISYENSDKTSVENVISSILSSKNRCSLTILAVFLHIVYQSFYNIGETQFRSFKRNRHLFLVERSRGDWERVISSIFASLSGCKRIHEINMQSPAENLSQYTSLGDLPLICRVPTGGTKLINAIYDSKINLIGVVDASMAYAISKRCDATFIPSFDGMEFDESIVQILSDCLLNMVKFAKKRIQTTNEFVSSSCPYKSILAHFCKFMKIKEDQYEDALRIGASTYDSDSVYGLDAFFEYIRTSIYGEREKKIRISNGNPPSCCSFHVKGTHVFVMDQTVIIGYNTVDFINRNYGTVFKYEKISNDLFDRKFLRPIDDSVCVRKERCWCVDKSVWEDFTSNTTICSIETP